MPRHLTAMRVMDFGGSASAAPLKLMLWFGNLNCSGGGLPHQNHAAALSMVASMTSGTGSAKSGVRLSWRDLIFSA